MLCSYIYDQLFLCSIRSHGLLSNSSPASHSQARWFLTGSTGSRDASIRSSANTNEMESGSSMSVTRKDEVACSETTWD